MSQTGFPGMENVALCTEPEVGIYKGKDLVYFLFFLVKILFSFFFSWSRSWLISFFLGQDRDFFLVSWSRSCFLFFLGQDHVFFLFFLIESVFSFFFLES